MNSGDGELNAVIAAEVLEALGSAAVVVNDINIMVQATTNAQDFGLLQDRAIVEVELLNIVDWARKSKETKTVESQINVGGRASKLWVQATAAPLGNGFVILTLEDRTEARRLEETRRDFVANISHELKTPIGAIGLLAETLQDATDDPAAVQKFASSLQREANRLGHIVQEIIELSRLQSATYVADSGMVTLNEVISDAIDRTQIAADAKQMRILADTNEQVFVTGNYEQLAIAVTNLIENAINYSDPNGQVGIALRKHDDTAEVVVTDSGVGIAI
ncbi:MAG: sensor histidine kinase, partial [Micrococcales bacterium]